MSKQIDRRPTAIRDLEESGAFIGRDSLDAELRFYNAAEDTIKRLAEMPQLGPVRDDLKNPRLEGLRSLPIGGFQNWLVFYRLTDAGVEIIRVLHGARGLEAILSEDRL